VGWGGWGGFDLGVFFVGCVWGGGMGFLWFGGVGVYWGGVRVVGGGGGGWVDLWVLVVVVVGVCWGVLF